MYSYCAVNLCICFIFIGHYRQGPKNPFICFSIAPRANMPRTIKCSSVAIKDKFRTDRFNQNLRKVNFTVKNIFLVKVLSWITKVNFVDCQFDVFKNYDDKDVHWSLLKLIAHLHSAACQKIRRRWEARYESLIFYNGKSC